MSAKTYLTAQRPVNGIITQEPTVNETVSSKTGMDVGFDCDTNEYVAVCLKLKYFHPSHQNVFSWNPRNFGTPPQHTHTHTHELTYCAKH